MTENDILSNQTNFFDEELMEQSPPQLPEEFDPLKAEKDALKKKRKKLFIVLGTALVSVMFVGTAALILLTPPKDTSVVVIPSPIVIDTKVEASSLSKRLDELEGDLRVADPIELDTPFPPVNLDLYLDRTQR